MQRRLIAILVQNQSGVLHRVTGLFMRRGYNIESLTVSTTGTPQLSRITAVLNADDETLEQVIKQLSKLVDVQVVRVLPAQESLRREIALVKLSRAELPLAEVLNQYNAKVVDADEQIYTVEIVGMQEEIDAFVEQAKSWGLVEMARSGLVALQYGTQHLHDEKGDTLLWHGK